VALQVDLMNGAEFGTVSPSSPNIAAVLASASASGVI
jgi:hypothetical protein